MILNLIIIKLRYHFTFSDQDKYAKKKLRASQSFDESVLGQEEVIPGNNVTQQSQNYHATSDPEGKEEELDDLEPELEAIYEPPPMAVNRPKKQSLTTPSESDEPQYSSSMYGRAPSQCSSISATQSFDLRKLWILDPNWAVDTGSNLGTGYFVISQCGNFVIFCHSYFT